MTTEKNRFLIQVLPPSQNVLPISSTVSHFFTRFERFSPSDYVRLHRHPLAQTQTVGRAKLAIASERTRAHGWLCESARKSQSFVVFQGGGASVQHWSQIIIFTRVFCGAFTWRSPITWLFYGALREHCSITDYSDHSIFTIINLLGSASLIPLCFFLCSISFLP